MANPVRGRGKDEANQLPSASQALLFLAGLILSIEMVFDTTATDLAVLLVAMVPVAIVATRLGFRNGRLLRG